jgi:hypothetical protein
MTKTLPKASPGLEPGDETSGPRILMSTGFYRNVRTTIVAEGGPDLDGV